MEQKTSPRKDTKQPQNAEGQRGSSKLEPKKVNSAQSLKKASPRNETVKPAKTERKAPPPEAAPQVAYKPEPAPPIVSRKSSKKLSRAASKSGYFGLTLAQLRILMECRRQEAVNEIGKLGGMQQICRSLTTSATNGLTGNKDDLELRRIAFGENKIPTKKPKSFFALLVDAVKDFTLIALIVAAAVSLGLWLAMKFLLKEDVNTASNESDDDSTGWIDSVAILVSVIFVVFVTAANDYQKEKQFRKLQKQIDGEHNFAVIRNGEAVNINVSEMVVGDICQIKYGDLIPADGILLASNDLKIDEASLTGESDHVKKGETTDPMILSGTHVMEGNGKVLVTAVGVNSQSGIIFTLLAGAGKKEKKKKKKGKKDAEQAAGKSDPAAESHLTIREKLEKEKEEEEEDKEEDDGPPGMERSVLQAKLKKMAVRIGYFGIAAAVMTGSIMMIKYCLRKYHIQKAQAHIDQLRDFVAIFITGITVLVVAIPEGLPLAVTLSLIFACKKMMKDHNLVRHLDACETMGSATAICSDKTGTLTTNRMTVVRAYINGVLSDQIPKYDTLNQTFADILIEAICLNSSFTSRVIKGESENEPPQQIGNKTECALLGFVLNIGKSYDKVRTAHPEESFTRVYTFNSVRKNMTTVIPLPNQRGWRIFTKGASEIVMFKCAFIFGKNGLQPFTPQQQQALVNTVIEPMAKDALRTICVSYKDYVFGNAAINEVSITQEPNWDNEADIVKNLTCLCIVGIEDPVRPEVPASIKQCQRAGITVRMVTGDNINTARSIATKCGIITPGDGGVILEGKDFNKLIRDENGEVTQELLDKVWPTLRVLARSSPTDKYILVGGIIASKITANQEVVAVTGDGTNDGPALKKADVGFAMGITGTDVAKEASDIILTDDNFTSIVKAVMWGRKVYDSIAKFLQFQLTVNIVAVAVAVIGAIAIGSSPLKPVQMLWVNLIMDTLASLALATELPTPDLLLRKPYGRTKSLISITMFKSMVGQAIYQLTVIFVILFHGAELLDIDDGRHSGEPNTHLTMIFNTFVYMTLFNEINSRKIHGQRNVFEKIYKNWIFLCIWFGTALFQVIIVQAWPEGFGHAFFTNALELEYWLWCLAFGVGTMAWAQLVISIPSKSIEKLLTPCGEALDRCWEKCCLKCKKKNKTKPVKEPEPLEPKSPKQNQPQSASVASPPQP